MIISFPMLGKFSTIISLNIFSYPFFYLLPLGPNVGVLNVVMEVSGTVLFSFHSFFIFLCFHYFHHSMFQLTYPSLLPRSAVVSLKCIFYFNYCVIIDDCLIFVSSRSLLNTFCMSSTHTSILFIYASILFLRFWINFTIITLNSFSGRLPISSSFVWSWGFLPCSFICYMFLCLFLLFN